MTKRHCYRSLRPYQAAVLLGLLAYGNNAAAQAPDDDVAGKLEAILEIVRRNAEELRSLRDQVAELQERQETPVAPAPSPSAPAQAAQDQAAPRSEGPDLLWRVPRNPSDRRAETVIQQGPIEIQNQTVQQQTVRQGPYQVDFETVTDQTIQDSIVDIYVLDTDNQQIQNGPVEIGFLQTMNQEIRVGPVTIGHSEATNQTFERSDVRIQQLEASAEVTFQGPVTTEHDINVVNGSTRFDGTLNVSGDLHRHETRNEGTFNISQTAGPITNKNKGRVDVHIENGPVTNINQDETVFNVHAPTTINNAKNVEIVQRSNALSSFDVNLGSDDQGELTTSARGRVFKPFGKGMAVQAQGEFMHYASRDEGQADLGLLQRWGAIQAGGFASFKYAKTSDWQNAGALGQAAVTLDYVFDRGRLGLFGTKSFLEGAVVDSRAVLEQPHTIVETYLDVVDQFGVSAAIAAWGESWFEGHAGALFRASGGTSAGGAVRYVHPLTPHLAFTFETGLNETMLGSSNTGRVVAGLQFGTWLSPHKYAGLKDGQPVPVDVPRIRYEALTRTIRNGNDRPVARAGSDQMGVAAGEVTLDGAGSFDPDQDPITFEWTVVAPGPLVELIGADTPHPTFLAEEGETYYFRLTVRDPYDGFDRDDVVVSVEDGELYIKRFIATPSYLPEPGVTALLWEVVGADRVEIDALSGPVANSGSSTVHVDASREFTLTAWRGPKSISETVAVTVACPEPVIELFSANPQQVAAGGSASLSWTVTGPSGTAVEINPGGTVGLTGDLTVSPAQTTVYTLTATSPCAGGQVITASRTLTVTVLEPGSPRILNFVASPTKILPGEQSLLSWEVENADEITIEPSSSGGVLNVDAVGTSTEAPGETTTYTLTARRGDKVVSAEATVEIYRQVRIVRFDIDRVTVANPGDPAVLSWEIENAVRVVITGVGPMDGMEERGSVVVHPVGQTIYTLIAYGENTETTAVVIVEVEKANEPPIAICMCEPPTPTPPPKKGHPKCKLDGGKSYDPDGDPIHYQWRVLAGPEAVLSDSASPNPTLEFVGGPGRYEVELMVTDDKGAMGFDRTEIAIEP